MENSFRQTLLKRLLDGEKVHKDEYDIQTSTWNTLISMMRRGTAFKDVKPLNVIVEDGVARLEDGPPVQKISFKRSLREALLKGEVVLRERDYPSVTRTTWTTNLRLLGKELEKEGYILIRSKDQAQLRSTNVAQTG